MFIFAYREFLPVKNVCLTKTPICLQPQEQLNSLNFLDHQFTDIEQ